MLSARGQLRSGESINSRAWHSQEHKCVLASQSKLQALSVRPVRLRLTRVPSAPNNQQTCRAAETLDVLAVLPASAAADAAADPRRPWTWTSPLWRETASVELTAPAAHAHATSEESVYSSFEAKGDGL